MRRLGLAAAAACLLLLAACAGPESWEREILAMDTVMKLTLYGKNAPQAGEAAVDRIQELEGLLSVTGEDSEIYAANHTGSAQLSPDAAALLARALALCRETGGALDVTIYPVVRAWGFTTGAYRVPDDGELTALLERVDYRQAALEGDRLTLPEGVELDLGAVAKGYTGDQLMALLAREGIASAIVELGGNVQALGAKPDGSPWRVALQAPEGGYAGVLEIVDKAVVTSGGYQRYFEQDGEIYWHIIDPAQGRPARSGLQSVTIVADEGTLCDGLSTALFVMGREEALDFWRTRDDFECVLISEDNTVAVTEGLEESFSLYGDWEGRALEIIRR